MNRILPRGTSLEIIEHDIAECEKDWHKLETSPAPADEKRAELQKRYRIVLEDKLRRCKEIGVILQTFGAKRKSELPQEGK